MNERDANRRILRRIDRKYLAPVAALLAATPGAADAHLTSSGLGPIYDGALHFLTSPEDCAAALALALLAGLRGATHSRRALFVLPCAWLLGSLVGLMDVTTHASATLSAVWLLVLGVLVAFDAKLPLAATTALAALLGIVHGYSNGSGMNVSTSVVVALLGLASTVFIVTALPAAAVIRFGDAWRRIAVRVAGSWIAASGLLLLGWAIRSG